MVSYMFITFLEVLHVSILIVRFSSIVNHVSTCLVFSFVFMICARRSIVFCVFVVCVCQWRAYAFASVAKQHSLAISSAVFCGLGMFCKTS